MNYKTSLFFCGFFTLVFFIDSSFAQLKPYDSKLIEENYETEIEAWRTVEQVSFRNKETTQLSDAYFENFSGLNYYAIDIKNRVVAKLTRLPQSEKVDLQLSNGTPYGFMHFGKINFFLKGEAVELQVYEFPHNPTSGPVAIFVPFTDLTTGEENFGGGRFMLINIPQDDQIIVDFNLAINPICVYDPDYVCPVSPKSNYIPQNILAGAKMYYDPRADLADK